MEELSFGNYKIITSTHYNRPDCTRQMLDHLTQCEGIEEYILLCGVEPGFPEVMAEINKYPFRKMVFLNERLLGCWGNKKSIIHQGFKLGEYVIHTEDDIIFAKDALRYFEWAKKYGDNQKVFSVSAFTDGSKLDNPDLITLNNPYSPLGWATWKHKYNTIVASGWDGSDKWIASWRKSFQHAKPAISRSKHIGTVRGIGSNPEMLRDMHADGQAPFAYAGLASMNGDFVQNREVYYRAISQQYNQCTDPTIKSALRHQMEVARTSSFERQILVNPNNEEWIKLSDNIVKSKNLSEYFKYEINKWSDDYPRTTKYYD